MWLAKGAPWVLFCGEKTPPEWMGRVVRSSDTDYYVTGRESRSHRLSRYVSVTDCRKRNGLQSAAHHHTVSRPALSVVQCLVYRFVI
jgi:hypothetical protein